MTSAIDRLKAMFVTPIDGLVTALDTTAAHLSKALVTSRQISHDASALVAGKEKRSFAAGAVVRDVAIIRTAPEALKAVKARLDHLEPLIGALGKSGNHVEARKVLDLTADVRDLMGVVVDVEQKVGSAVQRIKQYDLAGTDAAVAEALAPAEGAVRQLATLKAALRAAGRARDELAQSLSLVDGEHRDPGIWTTGRVQRSATGYVVVSTRSPEIGGPLDPQPALTRRRAATVIRAALDLLETAPTIRRIEADGRRLRSKLRNSLHNDGSTLDRASEELAMLGSRLSEQRRAMRRAAARVRRADPELVSRDTRRALRPGPSLEARMDYVAGQILEADQDHHELWFDVKVAEGVAIESPNRSYP